MCKSIMLWPSQPLHRSRHVLQCSLKRSNRTLLSDAPAASRSFASSAVVCKEDGSKTGITTPSGNLRNAALTRAKNKKQDDFAQRDFFFSILGSSTTKRDAKAYLQRFNLPKDSSKVSKTPHIPDPESSKTNPETETLLKQSAGHGVNVGNLYVTSRAVEQSPKFAQGPVTKTEKKQEDPLHIALVKLRAPQELDDQVLRGIGRTLRQLNRLGLACIVVVDCYDPLGGSGALNWKQLAMQQADRLSSAIDEHGLPGSRKIDFVLSVEQTSDQKPTSIVSGPVSISHRELLTTPLKRGIITVIPCIGYNASTMQMVSLSGNDVVNALAREFTGPKNKHAVEGNPGENTDQSKPRPEEVSVDRLILLDPLGGIPSKTRRNGFHVFLNLEQEYANVKEELTRKSKVAPTGDASEAFTSSDDQVLPPNDYTTALKSRIYLQNLELARSVMSLLPTSSSALLTTPLEAANLRTHDDGSLVNVGVGTRRSRNPLIHNLLTDKPVISSSLPAGRLGPQDDTLTKHKLPASNRAPTTFVKKGMLVTMFPDPKVRSWVPPAAGEERLSLLDPQIDLPRLVHLIDDSFGRKLDVQHYLNRVNGKIAGVIIAGEYEGGAILTWELPPGVTDDGTEETRRRMVPYLDKFAVLKRSQGAGGVADIVFTAMVRDCFPNGVCWRSRRNNPVNKWYFERSRGTWKLPDSNWAMFWTTKELSLDSQTFADYEAVCRTIEPSWADIKPVID